MVGTGSPEREEWVVWKMWGRLMIFKALNNQYTAGAISSGQRPEAQLQFRVKRQSGGEAIQGWGAAVPQQPLENMLLSHMQ